MSRLEELLEQLCPDGVEYQKIGDVCSTITDYTAAGSFADIAKNVKYITDAVGYAQLIRTTDLKSSFSKPDCYVYVDEHAFKYLWRVNLNCEGLVLPNVGNCGEVYYISHDTFPNQHNVLGPNAIWVKSDFALNRYLYHLFLSKEFQRKLAKIISPTGQTKFNKTNFKELMVPIPPLEVQREIVRILDQFTELTSELTSELTARKKQYEYYRNELLNCSSNSIEMQFGDLFRFQNGFAFKSNMFKDQGEPILRITNIKENRIDESGLVFFNPMDYKENLDSFVVEPGDIVVAMSGATTGKIGVNTTRRRFYLNQRVGKFVPNENIILKRYLYHLLSQNSNKLLEISQGSGAQPNLSSEKLKKLTAKIPPVSEQEKVVSLLDRFDTLCNDPTSGLPAEIESRRKQYEYYRDKLLSFEEK